MDWPGRHQTGRRRLDSAKFAACSQTVGTLFIRGPASTSLLHPFYPSFGMPRQSSLPCLWSVPVNTKSFFNRHRPYGWPSLDLLNKIKASGCHVVPVGHPNSPHKTSEWRMSFSVAERELILSASDVKFGCMYLLKSIKKHFWKGTTLAHTVPHQHCSVRITLK